MLYFVLFLSFLFFLFLLQRYAFLCRVKHNLASIRCPVSWMFDLPFSLLRLSFIILITWEFSVGEAF